MRIFLDNEQDETQYRNFKDFVQITDRLVLKDNMLVLADNIIICRYCETTELNPSTYNFLCQACGGCLKTGWLFIGMHFNKKARQEIYVKQNL